MAAGSNSEIGCQIEKDKRSNRDLLSISCRVAASIWYIVYTARERSRLNVFEGVDVCCSWRVWGWAVASVWNGGMAPHTDTKVTTPV
jgi:hypothetical protein